MVDNDAMERLEHLRTAALTSDVEAEAISDVLEELTALRTRLADAEAKNARYEAALKKVGRCGAGHVCCQYNFGIAFDALKASEEKI